MTAMLPKEIAFSIFPALEFQLNTKLEHFILFFAHYFSVFEKKWFIQREERDGSSLGIDCYGTLPCLQPSFESSDIVCDWNRR